MRPCSFIYCETVYHNLLILLNLTCRGPNILLLLLRLGIIIFIIIIIIIVIYLY